jgi:hypothetical protein
LLQSAEDVCIEELRSFYERTFLIAVVALMFDGILFEEHEGVTAKLQRTQSHIRKVFGWSHFQLDENPFDCGWHVPCEFANKAIIAAKFRALDKQFCACMMESKATR